MMAHSKKSLYFNELARFGQFIKYTLFRSPFHVGAVNVNPVYWQGPTSEGQSYSQYRCIETLILSSLLTNNGTNTVH